MTIRDFSAGDREAVLGMVEIFYHSPGVLHPIPTEFFAAAFDEMSDGGSSRLRGLLLEEDGKPAGFCSLSFSYSTEAGGAVVLIEEVYVSPEFRSGGIGSMVFDFVEKQYHGKAARMRLEVATDNTRAIALYERLGFKILPYVQMIREGF